MWDDSTNWIDSEYWSDVAELTAPVTTEVTTVLRTIVSTRATAGRPMQSEVVSAGLVTDAYELSGAVKAGFMLEKVFIIETEGQACTVQGGTTSEGDEWFTATACAASSITSIDVGKMLSTDTDLSVHVDFTAGSGFSVDVYCLTTKII